MSNVVSLQLVAIYEVLRDSNKRARYDAVLENGLPDWRQPVYYYRRVRKMGLFEMTVILFPIITIGQYIVSWASYLERKYTAVSFLYHILVLYGYPLIESRVALTNSKASWQGHIYSNISWDCQICWYGPIL